MTRRHSVYAFVAGSVVLSAVVSVVVLQPAYWLGYWRWHPELHPGEMRSVTQMVQHIETRVGACSLPPSLRLDATTECSSGYYVVRIDGLLCMRGRKCVRRTVAVRRAEQLDNATLAAWRAQPRHALVAKLDSGDASRPNLWDAVYWHSKYGMSTSRRVFESVMITVLGGGLVLGTAVPLALACSLLFEIYRLHQDGANALLVANATAEPPLVDEQVSVSEESNE